ncbi:uncharacterized protein B0P05DRAFT_555551 [Gilbertella persicaria]|uniref:Uncharacterized protein n=1 Tax=Rhizopus stolonifer TaxID=4846 RepID=A0A367K6N4_RHIST|nr:uncharacterized protein B0P05DRAFT_555551 [Gilbertella persicaria]KAI8063352.1 hypothetical protein B0P05DRAFT_555551 [Gilbertella persicaria]RCH97816.1 hypothetical protein CU098_005514 [Rhizopus stolonifer]
MTFSFALPRFSGSTLEPQSEPIMLYEPQYYQKGAGRAMHLQLVPTRPTPPLKRALKPPHIVIPPPNFDHMYIDDQVFSAWSYEEGSTAALWDSP